MNKSVASLIPPFTFEDFSILVREDQKADLLDGVIYMASPEGPDANELFVWLLTILHGYVQAKKLGKVYGSRVAFQLDEYNAPEPDVAFVSQDRLGNVQKGRVDGPPDLAVEIVTPDSGGRDYSKKRDKYEQVRVREYWIIDPMRQKIVLHRLNRHGQYKEVRLKKGVLSSQVVSGFWLRPEWLWQDPRPDSLNVLNQILSQPA